MVAQRVYVSVLSCPGETNQLPERNKYKRSIRQPIIVAMLEIETHNLSKTFGDLAAVRDLELRIPKGTLFGFLGPNGSGKSTTVRMLTGILPPTRGEVFIGGRSVINSPIEVKKRIGVLPEDLALFESLTIWEHLLMVGPVYGLSHKETETRAEQLLVYLDLWQGRHTYVDQASSGMRKKCSLAMALIHNPEVLFLDEPFEGIDPVSSRNIKDLLLLMTGKGVTVFLTSHVLEVVERIVQSFAIIVAGEIVCTQTMKETLSGGETLADLFFKHVVRNKAAELEWIG